MREFASALAPLMREYEAYQIVSGRLCESYAVMLRIFDRHCETNFPDAERLTQGMVDVWCAKRDTENNMSCRRRIYPVVSFIRFLQKRGATDVVTPDMPRREPNSYIPHAFTDIELSNFFRACDNIPHGPSKQEKTRRLTLPVFFRLLYSSGIRTNEVRQLRRSDVNLSDGVLNIAFSKGHQQHFAVLHDSMLRLMQRYDIAIDALYPDRTYFFPVGDDKQHTGSWVSTNFKQMWLQYNSAYAIPYDLRHNYAIENINSWTDDGFAFSDKLYYLSKSMGHSVVESTKYYYSIVPRLADVLAAHTDEDETIPEVPHASN